MITSVMLLFFNANSAAKLQAFLFPVLPLLLAFLVLLVIAVIAYVWVRRNPMQVK